MRSNLIVAFLELDQRTRHRDAAVAVLRKIAAEKSLRLAAWWAWSTWLAAAIAVERVNRALALSLEPAPIVAPAV